jgi:hypothetical protein
MCPFENFGRYVTILSAVLANRFAAASNNVGSHPRSRARKSSEGADLWTV